MATESWLKADNDKDDNDKDDNDKDDNDKDDDDDNDDDVDVDDKNLVVFVARQKKIQFWSRIFREVGGSVGAKNLECFSIVIKIVRVAKNDEFLSPVSK